MMKKLFLLILSCSLLTSCATVSSFFKKRSKVEEKEIRIVDVNGNYRPVKKQVPLLNSELLKQQNNANPGITNPNLVPNNQNQAMALDQNPNNQISPDQIIENAQGEITNPKTAEQPFNNQPSDDSTNKTAPKNDLGTGPSTEPLIENENAPSNAQIDESGEIDLGASASKPETGKKKTYKIAVKPTSSNVENKESSTVSEFFVQIGSFVSEEGANSFLARGKNISSKGFVRQENDGNKVVNKILFPAKNASEARKLLKIARKNGFKDAFITKN